MYHFVSGFINVTDLSADVAWEVPRCSILWQSPLNITVLGRACAERGGQLNSD